MNRRLFLTATASSLLVGCSRLSKAQRDQIALEANLRKELLVSLTRVPATTQFTTSKPPIDLLTIHPELKGLTKVAMRLHPRYSDEPAANESKIGGQFLWPKDEPWPTNSQTKQPLQPILQLKIDDAPPQCAFLPGCDLMQLLWNPGDDLKPVIAWRRAADVGSDLMPAPSTADVRMSFVPVPCRVFPERVAEWPGLDLLPSMAKDKLQSIPNYDDSLSAARGTKVGGYGHKLKASDSPSCSRCKRSLDYLLTIDGREWTTTRWRPVEETNDSRQADIGLNSTVHIFVCRRCEDWPIRYSVA